MLWFLDVLVVNLGHQWPLLSLLPEAALLGGKTPEQAYA